MHNNDFTVGIEAGEIFPPDIFVVVGLRENDRNQIPPRKRTFGNEVKHYMHKMVGTTVQIFVAWHQKMYGFLLR